MFLFEGHLVFAVRILLHVMNKAYCNYCLVLCCLFEDLNTLIYFLNFGLTKDLVPRSVILRVYCYRTLECGTV